MKPSITTLTLREESVQVNIGTCKVGNGDMPGLANEPEWGLANTHRIPPMLGTPPPSSILLLTLAAQMRARHGTIYPVRTDEVDSQY